MNMKVLLSPALLAMVVAGSASAQWLGDVNLTVKDSEEYGRYVADTNGRTLYLFTSDTQGKGDTSAQSACQDACAEIWPPVIAESEPKVSDQLQQDLLGTFQREGGQTQVTYGGWPLYYFVKDKEPDVVNGQDKHGFDGEWYLVSPDGTKNEQQPEE